MLVTHRTVRDQIHRQLAAEHATLLRARRVRPAELSRRLDERPRWRRVDLNRSFHILDSHPTASLTHFAGEPGCDRRDGGAVRAPPQVPPLVQPAASQQETLSVKLAVLTASCHGNVALVPTELVRRILGRTPHMDTKSLVGQFRSRAIHLFRQGGIKVLSRRGRFARPDCEHVDTVTIRNSGIERTVCETCGHVSFKGLEGMSGRASRSQFERASERESSMAG